MVLKAFQRIADSVEPTDSASDVGFQSPLLNDVIYSLQHVKKPISEILSVTSLKRLTEKERHEIWLDKDRYPDLEDQHMVWRRHFIIHSPCLNPRLGHLAGRVGIRGGIKKW